MQKPSEALAEFKQDKSGLNAAMAEEMFASGCKLVVSVTSAGQILAVRPPPYFVVVTRALRDEGTSYYYLPAARKRPVLCLAHVTNCMAQAEGDFEKGEAEGSVAVLGLLGRIAKEWRGRGKARQTMGSQ